MRSSIKLFVSKPEHNKHKQDKDQQHPKHLFC